MQGCSPVGDKSAFSLTWEGGVDGEHRGAVRSTRRCGRACCTRGSPARSCASPTCRADTEALKAAGAEGGDLRHPVRRDEHQPHRRQLRPARHPRRLGPVPHLQRACGTSTSPTRSRPVDCGDCDVIPGDPPRTLRARAGRHRADPRAGRASRDARRRALGDDPRRARDHGASSPTRGSCWSTPTSTPRPTSAASCSATAARSRARSTPASTRAKIVLVGISGLDEPAHRARVLPRARDHGDLARGDLGAAASTRAVERAREVVGAAETDGVYLSFDIDSLDAAHAPGHLLPDARRADQPRGDRDRARRRVARAARRRRRRGRARASTRRPATALMGGRIALEAMAFHAGAGALGDAGAARPARRPGARRGGGQRRARRGARRGAPRRRPRRLPGAVPDRLRPRARPRDRASTLDGAAAREPCARPAEAAGHRGRSSASPSGAATRSRNALALHRRARRRSRPSTARRYLFGAEADVFEAGDELVVAELAGRRVGPLICFDMEFPEPARALAARGRRAARHGVGEHGAVLRRPR